MTENPTRFSPALFLRRPESFRKARFIILAWSGISILAGIAILSSSNPFNLLIPTRAYPLAQKDQREWNEVYVHLDSGESPARIRRLFEWDENQANNIRKLSFLLSDPLTPEEGKELAGKGNMVHLPMFGLAIIHSWFFTASDGQKMLIVDLRKETFQDELRHYSESRPDMDQKKENALVQGYLKAFILTLLKNYPDAGKVRLMLDGNTGPENFYGFALNREFSPSLLIDGF